MHSTSVNLVWAGHDHIFAIGNRWKMSRLISFLTFCPSISMDVV